MLPFPSDKNRCLISNAKSNALGGVQALPLFSHPNTRMNSRLPTPQKPMGLNFIFPTLNLSSHNPI